MMMLSRNTNPKTGKRTWCEPVHLKRTLAFEKGNSVEIYRKNGLGQLRGQRFVRVCAVETHIDI